MDSRALTPVAASYWSKRTAAVLLAYLPVLILIGSYPGTLGSVSLLIWSLALAALCLRAEGSQSVPNLLFSLGMQTTAILVLSGALAWAYGLKIGILLTAVGLTIFFFSNYCSARQDHRHLVSIDLACLGTWAMAFISLLVLLTLLTQLLT